MRTFSTLVVTLVWPAAAALALALGAHGTDVSTLGLTLLAITTAGAYAFDRFRDGDAPEVRLVLLTAVALSALAAGVMLMFEPWRLIPVLWLAGLALTYVPFKRLMSKNVITATAWTMAVMVLPRAEPPAFDGSLLPMTLIIVCLMFANTTLCDLGSIDADRARRIKSISVCYGERAARWTAFVIAVVGAALAVQEARIGLAFTTAGHAVIARSVKQLRRTADALLLAAWI